MTEQGRAVTIYLLHFDPPGPNNLRHYIGACYEGNLEARLARHARLGGSQTVARALKARSTFLVVRLIHGQDWATERRLKNARSHRRMCPLCTPDLRKWLPPPYRRFVGASPPTPSKGFKSFG